VGPRVTSAKAILLVVALQGAALPLAAQGGAIERLFPPKPTGYLNDQTGVIPADAAARINALSERLWQATGAEIATVVLPTIGDRAAVDVAVAIGRAWGVGAKAAIGDPRRNTGMVILVVPRRENDPNSGQIFIATGQGLEGIVTDLQAGRVRDLMTPYFRQGDYARGLEVGVASLAGLIARGLGVNDSVLTAAPPPPARENVARRSRFYPALVQFIVLIGFLIVVLALQASNRQSGGRRGRRRRRGIWFGGWGGGFGGGSGGSGGFGGFGGFGGGGGGFGGFGGGGGFSGGGAGGRF